MNRIEPVGRYYETSIGRVGFSIAFGGLVAGGMAALLLWMGGQHSPLALLLGWLIGAFFSAVAIVIVAGPVWLTLHLMQRRGPGYALLTALVLVMLMFVGGQTYGFGLFSAPITDGQTMLFRWLSAIGTSLAVAAAAMAIALVMWRIAYRRVM